MRMAATLGQELFAGLVRGGGDPHLDAGTAIAAAIGREQCWPQ